MHICVRVLKTNSRKYVLAVPLEDIFPLREAAGILLGAAGAANIKGMGLPDLGRAPEIVAGLDAGQPNFVWWWRRPRADPAGRFFGGGVELVGPCQTLTTPKLGFLLGFRPLYFENAQK